MQHAAIVDLLMNGFVQRSLKRVALAHADGEMIREAAVKAENISGRQPLSTGLSLGVLHEVFIGLEDQQDERIARLDDVDLHVVDEADEDLLDRLHERGRLLQEGDGFRLELLW